MRDDDNKVAIVMVPAPPPSDRLPLHKTYREMDREEFLAVLSSFVLLVIYSGPEEAWAVRAAQHGDWSSLADQLELGVEITDEMRKFLIAVLRQEVKKPNNRAPSFKTRMRERDVALFVSEQVEHGKKKERAIEDAEKKFGVGRRHIQRCLRKYKLQTDEPRQVLSALLNHGQEKGWLPQGGIYMRRYPGGRLRFSRLTVPGSALTQYTGLGRSQSGLYTISLTALEPYRLEQGLLF